MTSKQTRRPADVLREARAKESREKRAKVIAAVDDMAAKGEPITFAAVAKNADVSRWLVYAEGVRDHIEAAQKKQGARQRRQREAGASASPASLATDLELARAEVSRLREDKARLTEAMRRKLGDQVDSTSSVELKVRVDELTGQLRDANGELETARRTIADQTEQIAELEEDLEASRAAHRTLMRQRNA